MKISHTFVLLGIGALALTGCNKEEVDTTAPTISISSPTDGEAFERGNQITIEGVVSDNEELSSLEIEIHSAEGHEHKSTANGGDAEWEIEETLEISGKQYTLNESFTIPNEADSGDYHVIINALDAAGNAADFVEIEVEVK